jgi:hypothetical protein
MIVEQNGQLKMGEDQQTPVIMMYARMAANVGIGGVLLVALFNISKLIGASDHKLNWVLWCPMRRGVFVYFSFFHPPPSSRRNSRGSEGRGRRQNDIWGLELELDNKTTGEMGNEVWSFNQRGGEGEKGQFIHHLGGRREGEGEHWTNHYNCIAHIAQLWGQQLMKMKMKRQRETESILGRVKVKFESQKTGQ